MEESYGFFQFKNWFLLEQIKKDKLKNILKKIHRFFFFLIKFLAYKKNKNKTNLEPNTGKKYQGIAKIIQNFFKFQILNSDPKIKIVKCKHHLLNLCSVFHFQISQIFKYSKKKNDIEINVSFFFSKHS